MNRFTITMLAILMAVATTANARETRVELPLQDLIDSDLARSAGIDGSVRFYLAGQRTPAVSRMGEDVGNRKTNAVGKSDVQACRWVALSVLRALQDGAKKRGADAVVDIVSYYKKREYRSAQNFECYAGGIVAGVALKGAYAKVN